MPGEKGDTYCTWGEFRGWADDHDWLLVIYDEELPLFLTPNGVLIQLTIDDEEFVTNAHSPAYNSHS